jgi:hypothetical protein
MARRARITALRLRTHCGDMPSLAASSSIVTPAASFSMNLRSRVASSRFVARRRFDPPFAAFLSASWIIRLLSDGQE